MAGGRIDNNDSSSIEVEFTINGAKTRLFPRPLPVRMKHACLVNLDNSRLNVLASKGADAAGKMYVNIPGEA